MGILNSIPRYRITGENKNAYKHLMHFYEQMEYSRRAYTSMGNMHDVYKSRNSWWNEYDLGTLRADIRNLMRRLIDPHLKMRVVGFKEIRYPTFKHELPHFLNWLHYITGCRFIFLTRRLDDTCKSKWWAENPRCKEYLSKFEKDVENYIKENHHQDWFHLHFEKLYELDNKGNKVCVLKPEDFKELFVWLGEKFDENKIAEVLDVKYGY